MPGSRRVFLALGLAALCWPLGLAVTIDSAHAASATEVSGAGAGQAPQIFYRTAPVAEPTSSNARAVFVFPNFIKVGLVFGASQGDGIPRVGPSIADTHSPVLGSWGPPTGAQAYGFVVLLMNGMSERYADRFQGWEFGVGPTLIVIDDVEARSPATATLTLIAQHPRVNSPAGGSGRKLTVAYRWKW